MLMHAVTPPRFAAGSLRSKKDKTMEYYGVHQPR